MHSLPALLWLGLSACVPSPGGDAPQSIPVMLDGDHLTFEVVIDGRRRRARLERYTLRAPDFQLLSWRDGQLAEVPPPTPATFRGTLDGARGDTVLASYSDGALHAVLSTDDTAPLHLEPTETGLHRLAPADASWDTHGACGLGDTSLSEREPLGGYFTGAETCEMHRAQIAFDADYAYYQLQGSDLVATVTRVEWLLAQVEEVYARDVQITHELTALVVRESPFYESDDDGGLVLDELVTVWNEDYGHIERDVVHLMTDRSTPGIAGLATVGTICTTAQYAWSKDAEPIIAHELGHNWGGGHCEDDVLTPFDNNILCGGDGMWIAENTRDSILAHRDSRDCLDVVDGPYSAPLPPYATTDTLQLQPEDVEGSPASMVLDVLANDQDANCEALSLDDFTATTARCGTVELAPGEAADGGDALTYQPPIDLIGDDLFFYQVSDEAGLETQSAVRISVRDEGLALYLDMDEASGSQATDWSAQGTPGELSDGFTFDDQSVPGVFARALRFDAEYQHVSLGHSDLEPPWTVSLFVTPAYTAEYSNTLLNSGRTSLRLEQWPATGKVGVTKYGVADWTFDYTLPLEETAHLAFVGTETEIALYVDGVLVDTLAESADAPLSTLGSNATDTLRGTVDELRAYSYAMDASDIEALVAGGRAEAPQPISRDSAASSDATLQWAPAADAQGYDLYLGPIEADVSSAEVGDDTHQGWYEVSQVAPDTLHVDETYYWRVDTIRGDEVLRGDVWRFHTLDPLRADVAGYWALDGDAFDRSDQLRVGAEKGGVRYEPGHIADAAVFEGDGAYIQLYESSIPAPWTLSLWVRRQTALYDVAALLDSGSTSVRLEQWGTDQKVGITEYGVADWSFDYTAPLDTWTHLVFATDGEGTELWADGIFQDRIDSSINLPQSSLGDPELSAWLDDVALWTRVLTDEEIVEVNALGLSDTPLLDLCPSPEGESTEPEDTALDTAITDTETDTATAPENDSEDDSVEPANDVDPEPGDKSGCGCATPVAPSPLLWSWLVLVVGLQRRGRQGKRLHHG